MPTYNYKCEKCGNLYSETRTVSENQYFTQCDLCKEGTYIEITE